MKTGLSASSTKKRHRRTNAEIEAARLTADAVNGDPRAAHALSAMSIVTDEDLAFERELQRMESALPPVMSEGVSENKLTKEQLDSDMLADAVENYQPARTINELRDQAFHAKQLGYDSVEASPELIKYFTRGEAYPPAAGYFMFDGIRAWAPGMYEQMRMRDGMSVEALASLRRSEAKA